MILWFDMDGVIADFDKRAIEVLGKESSKYEFIYGTKQLWDTLNAVEDFFLSFDPMPQMERMWEETNHFTKKILTALPKTGAEKVKQQKELWVKKHLGDVEVITCFTTDKPNYCSPGDILIDDRNINKLKWENKGGIFILHESVDKTLEALNGRS